MKKSLFIFFFILVFGSTAVRAEGTFGKGEPVHYEPRARKATVRLNLSEQEIARIKAFKQLIRDVDTKTLQQTVDEVERADDPGLELAMQEAIAKTYADTAREQKVSDQKQKEWLFSMVTINMAYLQFGAKNDESGNALNRLIRRKLREYLPPEVLDRPGFRYEITDPQRPQ